MNIASIGLLKARVHMITRIAGNIPREYREYMAKSVRSLFKISGLFLTIVVIMLNP